MVKSKNCHVCKVKKYRQNLILYFIISYLLESPPPPNLQVANAIIVITIFTLFAPCKDLLHYVNPLRVSFVHLGISDYIEGAMEISHTDKIS